MVIYMIKKKINWFLIIFALISIVTIYSTRSILPSNLDNIYIKQIFIYLIGFTIFHLFKNNKLIFKNVTIIYIISCLLLILLFFTKPINNARCWFTIYNLGTFQPSEFVKIVMVIMTAIILTKETKYKWFKIVIVFLIPSVLTFLEPDTGLVIIYAVGVLSVILCYIKKPKKLIIPIILALILSLLAIILFKNNIHSLRIERIINWKNQDGYQLTNALVAIGSNGFKLSFNKINTYFPEAYTDFIFASFAASFGYLLTIIFLIFVLYFDLFILKLAGSEKNRTNKLIIIGFFSMTLYQQVQNIGMNLGLLPITGITFPLISYGGSSLISYILILTIIKNMPRKKG